MIMLNLKNIKRSLKFNKHNNLALKQPHIITFNNQYNYNNILSNKSFNLMIYKILIWIYKILI